MMRIFSFPFSRHAFAFITLAACSLAARPAAAQTVVAPNTVAAAGYTSTAPFNDPSRLQTIYAASQFSAYTVPTLIRQIAFAPGFGQAATNYNFPSIRIDLSTTTQTVSGLSSTFASNVGTNDTVVFNGALSGTSAGTPTGSNNGAFDLVVNLTTPFLYVPGSGNVLLDITTYVTTTNFDAFLDNDTTANITRLVFVDNSTTATTGTVQPYGLVARFSTVPEPSSWAALCVGLSALAMLGRPARRRSA